LLSPLGDVQRCPVWLSPQPLPRGLRAGSCPVGQGLVLLSPALAQRLLEPSRASRAAVGSQDRARAGDGGAVGSGPGGVTPGLPHRRWVMGGWMERGIEGDSLGHCQAAKAGGSQPLAWRGGPQPPARHGVPGVGAAAWGGTGSRSDGGCRAACPDLGINILVAQHRPGLGGGGQPGVR